MKEMDAKPIEILYNGKNIRGSVRRVQRPNREWIETTESGETTTYHIGVDMDDDTAEKGNMPVTYSTFFQIMKLNGEWIEYPPKFPINPDKIEGSGRFDVELIRAAGRCVDGIIFLENEGEIEDD